MRNYSFHSSSTDDRTRSLDLIISLASNHNAFYELRSLAQLMSFMDPYAFDDEELKLVGSDWSCMSTTRLLNGRYLFDRVSHRVSLSDCLAAIFPLHGSHFSGGELGLLRLHPLQWTLQIWLQANDRNLSLRIRINGKNSFGSRDRRYVVSC